MPLFLFLSRNSLRYLEPDGSLPHSQEPPRVTVVTHLIQFTPYHRVYFRYILILFSHQPLRLSICLAILDFPTKTLHTLYHRTCHMLGLSHSPSSDHPNGIIVRVHTTRFPAEQSFPFCDYCLPLKRKFPTKHLLLEGVSLFMFHSLIQQQTCFTIP